MTKNESAEAIKLYVNRMAREYSREAAEMGMPPHTAALIFFIAHQACEQQAFADFGDDKESLADYMTFKQFFVDKCAEFANLMTEGVDVSALIKNGAGS